MILPFILIPALFIYGRFNPTQEVGAVIQVQLLALIFAGTCIRTVLNKTTGKDLIPVLVKTSQTELIWAILISISLVLETN
jgi:1,4-dihydroxy-2-naphthoate octaprenyltransferase